MESVRVAAHREGTLTSSRHFTLRDSFLASDIADNNNAATVTTTAGGVSSLAGLTLAAVLSNERGSSPIVGDHRRRRTHTSSNHIVRTLLDIIRNEEATTNPSTSFVRKRTWRSFKDRLGLRRLNTGSQWSHSVPVPQSGMEAPGSRLMSQNSMRNSLGNNSIRTAELFNVVVPGIESAGTVDEVVMRDNAEDRAMLRGIGGAGGSGSSMRLSAALAAEREETRRRLSRELVEEEDDRDQEEVTGAVGNLDRGEVRGDDRDGEGDTELVAQQPAQQAVRMSLMDLLEETDRQTRIPGPTYRLDGNEGNQEENEEEEEQEEVNDDVKGGGRRGGRGLGKVEHSCCVCMVRHKGAAFIPCGHTFCRICSRELWVQRGNCPLCNGFILEILDIF